jgi:hypothetical protein
MVNPNKAGIALGALIGGWHLLWAVVVAIGWAQWLINFVFWMHFIVPPYTVKPFQARLALILIGVTSVTGYVLGYVFAVLWNWLHGKVGEAA